MSVTCCTPFTVDAVLRTAGARTVDRAVLVRARRHGCGECAGRDAEADPDGRAPTGEHGSTVPAAPERPPSGAASDEVVGQLAFDAGVPRPVPAGERQHRVEQPGGESPDEQPGDLEPGADAARTGGAPGTGSPDRPARRSSTTAQPATSTGSTAATGCRVVPPGEHGCDDEAGDRDVDGRQLGEHGARWPGRARPPRRPRAARRRPRRRRSGSTAPPGKATWPAWSRRSAERSMSSTLGPSSVSHSAIRTAESRPEPSSGGRNRDICSGTDRRSGARERLQPLRERLAHADTATSAADLTSLRGLVGVGRALAVRRGTAARSGTRRTRACGRGTSGGRARSPGATGSSIPSWGSGR